MLKIRNKQFILKLKRLAARFDLVTEIKPEKKIKNKRFKRNKLENDLSEDRIILILTLHYFVNRSLLVVLFLVQVGL